MAALGSARQRCGPSAASGDSPACSTFSIEGRDGRGRAAWWKVVWQGK